MKIILLLFLTTIPQPKPDLIIDFKWGISKQQVIKMVGNKYISQTDTTVTYIYKMYKIRPHLDPNITYYFHKDKLCRVSYDRPNGQGNFMAVAVLKVERILKRKRGSFRGDRTYSNWIWETEKTVIDVFKYRGDGSGSSSLTIRHKDFSPPLKPFIIPKHSEIDKPPKKPPRERANFPKWLVVFLLALGLTILIIIYNTNHGEKNNFIEKG